MMWWDWDYWPMHHFFFGPLFMIAIFAIRYARGEINKAEYEERRQVLRS